MPSSIGRFRDLKIQIPDTPGKSPGFGILSHSPHGISPTYGIISPYCISPYIIGSATQEKKGDSNSICTTLTSTFSSLPMLTAPSRLRKTLHDIDECHIFDGIPSTITGAKRKFNFEELQEGNDSSARSILSNNDVIKETQDPLDNEKDDIELIESRNSVKKSRNRMESQRVVEEYGGHSKSEPNTKSSDAPESSDAHYVEANNPKLITMEKVRKRPSSIYIRTTANQELRENMRDVFSRLPTPPGTAPAFFTLQSLEEVERDSQHSDPAVVASGKRNPSTLEVEAKKKSASSPSNVVNTNSSSNAMDVKPSSSRANTTSISSSNVNPSWFSTNKESNLGVRTLRTTPHNGKTLRYTPLGRFTPHGSSGFTPFGRFTPDGGRITPRAGPRVTPLYGASVRIVTPHAGGMRMMTPHREDASVTPHGVGSKITSQAMLNKSGLRVPVKSIIPTPNHTRSERGFCLETPTPTRVNYLRGRVVNYKFKLGLEDFIKPHSTYKLHSKAMKQYAKIEHQNSIIAATGPVYYDWVEDIDVEDIDIHDDIDDHPAASNDPFESFLHPDNQGRVYVCYNDKSEKMVAYNRSICHSPFESHVHEDDLTDKVLERIRKKARENEKKQNEEKQKEEQKEQENHKRSYDYTFLPDYNVWTNQEGKLMQPQEIQLEMQVQPDVEVVYSNVNQHCCSQNSNCHSEHDNGKYDNGNGNYYHSQCDRSIAPMFYNVDNQFHGFHDQWCGNPTYGCHPSWGSQLYGNPPCGSQSYGSHPSCGFGDESFGSQPYGNHPSCGFGNEGFGNECVANPWNCNEFCSNEMTQCDIHWENPGQMNGGSSSSACPGDFLSDQSNENFNSENAFCGNGGPFCVHENSSQFQTNQLSRADIDILNQQYEREVEQLPLVGEEIEQSETKKDGKNLYEMFNPSEVSVSGDEGAFSLPGRDDASSPPEKTTEGQTEIHRPIAIDRHIAIEKLERQTAAVGSIEKYSVKKFSSMKEFSSIKKSLSSDLKSDLDREKKLGPVRKNLTIETDFGDDDESKNLFSNILKRPPTLSPRILSQLLVMGGGQQAPLQPDAVIHQQGAVLIQEHLMTGHPHFPIAACLQENFPSMPCPAPQQAQYCCEPFPPAERMQQCLPSEQTQQFPLSSVKGGVRLPTPFGAVHGLEVPTLEPPKLWNVNAPSFTLDMNALNFNSNTNGPRTAAADTSLPGGLLQRSNNFNQTYPSQGVLDTLQHSGENTFQQFNGFQNQQSDGFQMNVREVPKRPSHIPTPPLPKKFDVPPPPPPVYTYDNQLDWDEDTYGRMCPQQGPWNEVSWNEQQEPWNNQQRSWNPDWNSQEICVDYGNLAEKGMTIGYTEENSMENIMNSVMNGGEFPYGKDFQQGWSAQDWSEAMLENNTMCDVNSLAYGKQEISCQNHETFHQEGNHYHDGTQRHMLSRNYDYNTSMCCQDMGYPENMMMSRQGIHRDEPDIQSEKQNMKGEKFCYVKANTPFLVGNLSTTLPWRFLPQKFSAINENWNKAAKFTSTIDKNCSDDTREESAESSNVSTSSSEASTTPSKTDEWSSGISTMPTKKSTLFSKIAAISDGACVSAAYSACGESLAKFVGKHNRISERVHLEKFSNLAEKIADKQQPSIEYTQFNGRSYASNNRPCAMSGRAFASESNCSYASNSMVFGSNSIGYGSNSVGYGDASHSHAYNWHSGRSHVFDGTKWVAVDDRDLQGADIANHIGKATIVGRNIAMQLEKEIERNKRGACGNASQSASAIVNSKSAAVVLNESGEGGEQCEGDDQHPNLHHDEENVTVQNNENLTVQNDKMVKNDSTVLADTGSIHKDEMVDGKRVLNSVDEIHRNLIKTFPSEVNCVDLSNEILKSHNAFYEVTNRKQENIYQMFNKKQ